jgi:hypothetical protein
MKRGLVLAFAAVTAASLALGGALAQQRVTRRHRRPAASTSDRRRAANLISKTFPNMQATAVWGGRLMAQRWFRADRSPSP